MEIIHQTPVLQEKTSTGLEKFWQGQVLTNGVDFFTCSRTYQALKGGGLSKETFSTPVRIEAKNIGRANQTQSREQALAEIKADEARKRKKGYIGAGETKNIKTLPMLAHSFPKRKHEMRYPAAAQRKLDGARGLLQSGEGFWSRGGNDHIAECVAHLLFDTQGYIVDGEIMLDKSDGTFQDTMRALKKYRPELSPKLRFRVFDIVDETKGFSERHQILRTLLKNAPPNVELVDYEVVHNEAQVEAAMTRFIEEGEEGVMVRAMDGGYVIGNRSNHLQKWKVFENEGRAVPVEDDEFIITDVVAGKGLFADVAIMVCRAKNGQDFRCCAPGNLQERRELYQKRAELIGQELTIKYQGLTDEGRPRFPVGLNLRRRDIQG